jgi:hypothetical protein
VNPWWLVAIIPAAFLAGALSTLALQMWFMRGF